MKYLGFAKVAALAAMVVGASSCSMLFGSRGGPETVDNLISRVETVYVACEMAKENTRGAINQLKTITSSEFQGEPAAAHSSFMKTIDRSESQAEDLRLAMDELKEAGPPVFEQWAKDLEAFDNAAMRRRSLQRLLRTRELYDNIGDAAAPAQIAFAAFNRGLRDHALFLRHDFNTASMADIQEDAKAQAASAAELEVKLNACLQASRAYMESVSLPAGPDEAADPTPDEATDEYDDEAPPFEEEDESTSETAPAAKQAGTTR